MKKFIVTRELGRLVKWLRILGFDTQYFAEDNISSLIIEALRDNRIILTRNQKLSDMYTSKVLFIKSERFKEQIGQVLKALKIHPNSDMMFSRCIVCNVELAKILKEKTKHKVPEYVFKTQDTFLACPNCERIYWQGTHWGNVKKTLDEIGIER